MFITFNILCLIFIILQSTVLHIISIYTVVPDFSWIILTYYCFYNGKMFGQVSGFIQGVVFDILTVSPPGFNAFIRTLTSYLIGSFKNVVQLDLFLLPLALVFLSFLSKGIITLLFALILGQTIVIKSIFTTHFLIEVLYSTVISPFIFFLLNLLVRLVGPKRSFI